MLIKNIIFITVYNIIYYTIFFIYIENGTRILKMDNTFFTGYRKNAIHPEEVVIDLFIPFTQKVSITFCVKNK